MARLVEMLKTAEGRATLKELVSPKLYKRLEREAAGLQGCGHTIPRKGCNWCHGCPVCEAPWPCMEHLKGPASAAPE